jgi:hypothetical protein
LGSGEPSRTAGGQKAIKKKRMSEEGFQFRYFQSAGIGARSARLKYKPHLKGKENENE